MTMSENMFQIGNQAKKIFHNMMTYKYKHSFENVRFTSLTIWLCVCFSFQQIAVLQRNDGSKCSAARMEYSHGWMQKLAFISCSTIKWTENILHMETVKFEGKNNDEFEVEIQQVYIIYERHRWRTPIINESTCTHSHSHSHNKPNISRY